jgi:sRNA-binding protein
MSDDDNIVTFPKGQTLLCAIAEECAVKWPEIFAPPPRKPLAIGSGQAAFVSLLNSPPFSQLIARGHLKQGELWTAFDQYIDRWVHTPLYYSFLKLGARRYNLDGKPCGVVIAEEANYAQQTYQAACMKACGAGLTHEQALAWMQCGRV